MTDDFTERWSSARYIPIRGPAVEAFLLTHALDIRAQANPFSTCFEFVATVTYEIHEP